MFIITIMCSTFSGIVFGLIGYKCGKKIEEKKQFNNRYNAVHSYYNKKYNFDNYSDYEDNFTIL